MIRRKEVRSVRRIVWRFDAAHPGGAYVQPGELEPKGETPTVAPERNWVASSFELMDGVHVSETPMDTLPGEFIDEFSKARR
jgi:hypothetical protein